MEYISVFIRKLIQWNKQYHPRVVNRKLRCLVTNGNHLRYKDEYSDHLLLQRPDCPYSLSQTFHGLSCYKSSLPGGERSTNNYVGFCAQNTGNPDKTFHESRVLMNHLLKGKSTKEKSMLCTRWASNALKPDSFRT